MDALTALSSTSITPLDIECRYQFQSSSASEAGSLCGWIVERSATLQSDDVNSCLLTHPRWLGKSKIRLKPAVITQRAGVFERHADALYYRRCFSFDAESPIDHDLLDVTKLEALFNERLPHLKRVFDPESFEWVVSILGNVTTSAVNEYMCHEGGHSLGFPVSEKYSSRFFRLGGRLRWPLVFAEEYRADANSWSIACRLLGVGPAAAVILYTIVHRFGLATQNLREGRPGAGYVPFLHFSALLDFGVIRLVKSDQLLRVCFNRLDPALLVEGALAAYEAVDREINRFELRQDHEECAEASLAFATARLQRDKFVGAFRDVFGGAVAATA